MQGIEGVEKFFLDGLAIGDELDVIDHQQIHVAETMPKLRVLAHTDGLNEFVGKGFAGHVQDSRRGEVLLYGMADGVHEMGLA